MQDARFTERAWLIKNGMPPELAFALDTEYVLAFSIAFQQMEDHSTFNFDTWTFEKPTS